MDRESGKRSALSSRTAEAVRARVRRLLRQALPFEITPNPHRAYRIGKPALWVWPAWEYVGSGRFDDPQDKYRVLYTADSYRTAFIETLAQFRPRLGANPGDDFEEKMGRIPDHAGDVPTNPSGQLTLAWLEARVKGSAYPHSRQFVVLDGASSVAVIRDRMAEVIRDAGFSDINAAMLALDRSGLDGKRLGDLTQQISRFIYEQPTHEHPLPYGGLTWGSRFGGYSCRNYAFFERVEVDGGVVPVTDPYDSESLASDDEDFVYACKIHGIQIDF
jgi:hypothetical protein